jgi:NAD(P)-dependent dehydrogenase (short-subunit alcohol dehydrogenase family)
VILVTGGGGSIGSELCRQIAQHNPKQLIVFDIYENNAHAIGLELKDNYPDLNLVVLIGSVRDSRRISQVFQKYKPEVVYHAAAHKHVPLMEDSPCESIKNNAIGTYKTAHAAMLNGCKRFVLISTDKAVNPTNIMGASKRLCEMIIQSFDRKIKEGKAGDLITLRVHPENTDDVAVRQCLAEEIKTETVDSFTVEDSDGQSHHFESSTETGEAEYKKKTGVGSDAKIHPLLKVAVIVLIVMVGGFGAVAGCVAGVVLSKSPSQDYRDFGSLLMKVSIAMLVVSFLCCLMSTGMGFVGSIFNMGAVPQISY